MWIKLFRAEWRKITGNRWVTGCMIWIFPILGVLATILMILGLVLSSSFRNGIVAEPATWTEVMILPWGIPTNPVGRGILLGFTAVLFAGEYQWNTWKTIVPRSRRVPLILTKFFTVAVFVIFAFTLMSLLLTAGVGLVSAMAGASYGPELNGEVLSQFAEDYGLQMANAFIATMIAACYAALAAMITRSILASAIFAIMFTIIETALILPLWLLAEWLQRDFFLHIYRFLPNSNLNNMFTWLANDVPPEGMELPVSGEVILDSLEFSVVMLVIWVVGLVALTAYLFQRQDITN
jgi:ABC-type transport system involved in multi-copper enzyme maturation permease subunit